MEVVSNNYLPGDSRLVEQIVYELKSQGIFDHFRKECISDVDTKPAYQNLRQRVEGSVASFLKQQIWSPDMNKNQVREQLRKNIYESGYLETGVERIVDQVVNPKINTVFLPQVEDVVYRFLGIAKPIREVKKELKVNIADLLPTDLEAVSPGSVHSFKDEIKPEDIPQTLNDSLNNSSKLDEDESPPFEPLDTSGKLVSHEENSVDSNLSGFSGLQSHGSNRSSDNKVCQMEISSQDSQNSSESRLSIITCEDAMKMDICEDSTSQLMKSTSIEASTGENSNEMMKMSIEEELFKEEPDKSATDDRTSEVKPRVSEKHTSKDRRDDKHRKSSRSSSKDHNSSSTSNKDKNRKYSRSSKDKDKSDKSREKSDKGREKSDKEKTDKEKSSKEKDRSEKAKEKSDKDKSTKDKVKSDHKKSDKDKERSSRDKEKSSRDKHRSDKDKTDKSGKQKESCNKEKSEKYKDKHSKEKSTKEKENREKDKSDKDKTRSSGTSKSSSKSSSSKKESSSSTSSHGKEKSRSSSTSSSKDKPKSDDAKPKKDSKHSVNGNKHSADTRKEKDKKRDSKKQAKDDHYSSKDTKNGRRSTDRDSNDGQSSKQNFSSSSVSENTAARSEKSNQALTSSNSSSGDTGNSDQNAQVDAEKQPREHDEVRPVMASDTQKLIKPKFASNFQEARKIMKIRRQLAMLERQNQLGFTRIETCIENGALKVTKTDENVVAEKAREKEQLQVEEKVSCAVDMRRVALKSTELSQENWEALEARLAEEMANINYNSYEDYDDNSSGNNRVEEVQVEAAHCDDAPLEQLLEQPLEQPLEQSLEFNNDCISTSPNRVKQLSVIINTNDMKKQNDHHTTGDECRCLSELIDGDKSICRYLERPTEGDERNLQQLYGAIEMLERDMQLCLAKVQQHNNSVRPAQRGRKRKVEENVDLKNNNKAHFEQTLVRKRGKPPGSNMVSAKAKKEKDNTDILTNDRFTLPLSPAESEKSNDKREEELIIIPTKQRRFTARSTQRYSSEDLYKPRPVFSRRSKDARKS